MASDVSLIYLIVFEYLDTLNLKITYCVQDSDLDMSVHGSGLCSPDQALQLSTAVVLCLHGELLDADVTGQQVVLTHQGRVDVEDLNSPLFIR